ncbi:MAG: S8 family serine peptidase, partial [Saprospiraceae bacterium]|nr:S8 family serine peptidase [Saprospiraceae bacterium]
MKIGLCLKALLRAVVISLICTADIRAQSVVPGEWLVQLESGSKPLSLLEALKAHLNTTLEKLPQQPAVTNSLLGRISIKPISTNLNTWLISVPQPLEVSAEWVAAQKEVVLVQPNHYLTQRTNPTPNDPLFPSQWQYLNMGLNDGIPGADLDAMEAWSHTTGGLSAAGDTIVIAVIDGGVAYNHPDLSANLWKNWKEKPGDGLDNDDNGFIDDFLGWNVFSQSDLIQGFSTTHGTPVCGIVGAQGNNNIGVTGVNWNIKIMFVSGGVTVSSILAAYDYVLQSRKKYNETNGAQGAFVVAVNSSWGIDFGMPFEAPLWCQVYDELGAAGILGVAATANMPVNVDEVGDLPTTCPSDYLISVSSLTNKDLIAPTAAWGQTNIDLASYGEQVFTLTSTD